jgi:hypothetical protein
MAVAQKTETIPLREATMVSVDLLDFDRENPRFTPDKKPEAATDEAIIRQLSRTADLAELIESIGTNGYIPIEPLIVFSRGERYVVLEGNRRLAAVKCLRDPDLATRCEVSVPKDLPGEVRATLEAVNVYRVEDSKKARDLIGFKHINGPQAWDAYAKALFAMRWLDDERSKPSGLSLQDISRRMGDKNDTLHRMVTAAYVIAQAERAEIYVLDDRTKKHFSFSHLYTALSYPEYTAYLGMPRPARNEDPIVDPVPPEKYSELRTLLEWLYGSKRGGLDPIIESQAKDLNRLKTVLGHTAALRELTERRRLDDAVISATPASSLFATNLIESSATLRLALDNITGFDPISQEDLIEVAKNCLDRADSIYALVERAAQKSKK